MTPRVPALLTGLFVGPYSAPELVALFPRKDAPTAEEVLALAGQRAHFLLDVVMPFLPTRENQ